MVHRPDLPDRYLASGLFPLVICPEATPATIILPARYWGDDLLALWRQRQAADPG